MRRYILGGAALLLGACMTASAQNQPDQAELENAFVKSIKPEDLSNWMRILAAEPNQVGSSHDKANAEYQLNLFKRWGWDTHIETFDVLYPTPIAVSLELLGEKSFKATLTEKPLPEDASSQKTKDVLPAYLAYQGDGDVTSELVYVNYGTVEDYKTLERLGVSVKGKIAIARYGAIWRGLKPELAHDHGAIGCIIYSDPRDDGYSEDNVYPKGAMRPPQGIQRGSAQAMMVYPGDPLTPGVGATKDAKRLSRQDAITIQKIPALPISYADAQVLLASLKGPVAPPNWRGSLPITYHVGPSTSKSHLVVKSNWGLKTIYDVIATIKGSAYPDQWIVRANHHDGWVFGASDPLSGQVALMAEAQSIGSLLKQGWRPKRTLVYASWDAEEPMVLGSTEWVEAHSKELQEKVLLYINTDGNERGYFDADGSDDLTHWVNDIAKDVIDPETRDSIGVRHRARIRLRAAVGGDDELKKVAKAVADPKNEFPLNPLGSGSDYSPFIDHLGIASLNLQFTGEGNSNGVYHSAYDTFEHHSRFVDPGFVYDALLGQTVGRLVLRLADGNEPLPRPAAFATAVAGYIGEVKKLAGTKREQAETQAGLLRDHVFDLAEDPTKPKGVPAALDQVPEFDFAKLDAASTHLGQAAKAYEAMLAEKRQTLSLAQWEKLQSLMFNIDQTLISDGGLPGRPWYRNLIYAPGRYTGYGAKTLPGVREAIEEQRWSDANRYIGLTAGVLDAYAGRLEQAIAILSGS